MIYIVAGILLVGPIIFFHELGHLLAAKLVDVKVTRFSIGFGRPFARFQAGETEYCLAPIPLGGYVTLLGQHPYDDIPPEEADRALGEKPLWAKWLVLAAGPLANMLLPVVLYFFFFLSHTLQPPPIIGGVFLDSPAHEAGLIAGDRIVAIEGKDVRSWYDMQRLVGDHPEDELLLQIERDGRRFERFVTPQRTFIYNQHTKEREPIGRLGILMYFVAPQIGILDETSPAYQEGLRTGDVITSINGEPVINLDDLERQLDQRPEGQIRLTYLRATPVKAQLGTLLYYESHHAQLLPRKETDFSTGIMPGNTFVRTVEPDSPASKAGLKPGDRILEVEHQPIKLWSAFASEVSRRPEDTIHLRVQSPGEEPRDTEITPEIRSVMTAFKSPRPYVYVGVEAYQMTSLPDAEPIRGRVTYAAENAVLESTGLLRSMAIGMKQMFTFERGMEELGSVVGMFYVAGVAAQQGPGTFLQIAAILSMSVGLLNLLPIPVLDGGHLMFYTIEAIRRRPLSQRSREIASAVGLVIVLMLLLVALRNDIVRIFFT